MSLYAEIANAPSMRKLAEIAITKLETLSKAGPVHQLCGPMSTGGFGSREANIEAFRSSIDYALEKGLRVFNQLPFQGAMLLLTLHQDPSSYRVDILEEFYQPLFESGLIHTVHFLPGWESSKGATWERNLVQKMGKIQICDYPKDWWNAVLKRIDSGNPVIK